MKKAIIVGCGISGAALANKLANAGWEIDIYEKNSFVGGNCYDSYDKAGILIHNFGPHIFHTNNEEVYSFISQFTKFNNFTNKVLVNVDNKLFPLPINFKSIEIIMGDKAKTIIDFLKAKFKDKKTVTLFELRQIENKDVQEFINYISRNVYFNYSSKMWGTKFENIDPSTINRVKIILGYEHNYFPEDKYQGLPIDGYTQLIKKMIEHPNIHLHLNNDVLKHIQFNDAILFDGNKVDCPLFYCGTLDEALGYKYGILPYRSLLIKFETINNNNFQQTAVINYPADATMTRIAEYKWMTQQEINGVTTISKEYPGQYSQSSKDFNVRYYPISNPDNLKMYNQYASFFKQYKNFYPLGRLAQYKYFDMDDAIEQSLNLAKELINA